MKKAICFCFSILLFLTNVVGAQQIPEEVAPVVDVQPPPSFFSSPIFQPMRITLRQEMSYKVKEPTGIINNRSSLRLEYNKSFFDHFSVQLDYKLNGFWAKDHRAEARNKKLLLENNLIEGFLQFSIRQTSIKAGIQKMIWGESEAGAITDVISPRDYSELFFISLEQSRRGQPVVSVDQFTRFGDWTVFYVPFPTFNRYPLTGTAYYHDRFNGNSIVRDEKSYKDNYEYGVRWKRTFGSVDLSGMCGSLMDNDYAFNVEGFNPEGKVLVTKKSERFNIIGMTFSYQMEDFILKGEAAEKLQKAYNNSSFQIVKRNALDAGLALEYTPGGGSLSLSGEIVNSHVTKWNDEIQVVPQNTTSFVFTCYKTYFNQDFSIFWMSIYTHPYTSLLNKLMLSYTLNDNVTLFLNGFYPYIGHKKNPNWLNRDQKQIDFKIQYQF